MRKIYKIKSRHSFVEPDEIFLDSENLQGFDEQQFEGRIEKPITKKTVLILGGLFLIIGLVFLGRLGVLQVKKGEAYFARSENNTLEKVIVFADRGIIYDRNGKELAWNKSYDNAPGLPEDQEEILKTENSTMRAYYSPGFSHVLGYVSSPIQDSKGEYWQEEFIGKDGLEKMYNNIIEGINGQKLIERDAHGEIHSENVINAPQRGNDLITTIDRGIQEKMFESIKELAGISNYQGGAGIMLDAITGEIIASTSFPEYSSEILSLGKDKAKINSYLTDKRMVFMDRTLSGLYTPGSIVKPILALAALNERIISPEKEILSTGSISIPNPYDKTKETIFKDWKAHGWTDMREAIAVSSDVYFYTIGGGFEGQRGLGIANIEKYTRMFGIGEETGVDLPDEKTGTIPGPAWKAENFKGDIWRIGDTYNTAIGQYGFQVTPFEMARAISAIANKGTLITPHFLKDASVYPTKKIEPVIESDMYTVVQEGMREAVEYGTAALLNVPYTKVSAKTGTAQVGISKSKINSWVVGFFPFENPKYVFVIMMEQAPSSSYTGAPYVMRQVLDYMYNNAPEYFTED